MLNFVLKKKYFEEIKAGRKTVEYREVKDYWTKRLINEFKNNSFAEDILRGRYDGNGFFDHTKKHHIIFRNGYTSEILGAEFVSLYIVSGKKTPLNTDKDVYAIHFQNVVKLEDKPLIKTGFEKQSLRIPKNCFQVNNSVNDFQ